MSTHISTIPAMACWLGACGLVAAVGLRGQEPTTEPATEPGATASAPRGIDPARVREVLEALASDEMAGRDSPSPQLERARAWLETQFERAGLRPGAGEGQWSHRYTLEGTTLDSGAIGATIHGGGGPVPLQADRDVRWWRGGRAMDSEPVEVAVSRPDAPLDPRLLRNGFGRKPILLEVAQDDPLWASAAGKHGLLRGNRAGSQPVLLVRQGLLPAGEIKAEIRLPEPEAAEIELANVVAVLEGVEHPDEFVIVSAHYDHIGIRYGGGEDSIYNGADDNATGTTALVCLAEALAAGPRPARSVMFVAFSAEEKGLRGSRAFAADPPIDLAKVIACANIEMIGRPEEGKERQAWVTGASLSDFAERATASLARAGIQCVEFPMASRLFYASDNLPLASAGVVAHSISAGHLHSDYHQAGDEVDKIHIDHMTAVIRGLEQVVLDLANGDAPPRWNEDGEAALERIRQRGR